LLLLVALIYLPFLKSPLVFDDLDGVISSYIGVPFDFHWRWFAYTTLNVTWVFFGDDTSIFRAQNLLLHGLNVLLLLLLLRVWMELFITDVSKAKLSNWGAWLGALVFACHPLSVYGVGYLMQRSILMATMFTLVMQLAYLRGLLEHNKNYLALAVAAYFIAVFSKEHSIMAPAILLPLTWLMRDRIKLPYGVLLATWAGFVLVALLGMMNVKDHIGTVYEPDAASLLGRSDVIHGATVLHLLSVLTQAGLFFKYFLLMLLPNPAWMSIDMRETFFLSYRDWTSWIGLTIFIIYGLVALRCLFKGGRIALFGLALLYPWLLFMTEFSSVRVQEIFVLYRSYLWLPGFILIFPLLVSALPERKIILAGVVAAIVLVPFAWNRLWVMADDYRLWNDAVLLLHGEDRLGAARTYYGRAHASATLKNWDAAITDYRKSILIDSSRPQVHMALATAYFGARRNSEALAIIDQVIEHFPKDAKAYYNKGIVLREMGDKDGALKNIQASCNLGAVIACATVNMGKLKQN
jgi:tetratricopeptide (TPR) repeat protein